ncbi:ROK family protein [candidate division KSB1 bacterium]|nr:ROK family protein [candidate division KSB1 bacterium]
MIRNYAIALDVGGTSVKSAIVSSEGKLANGSIRQTPIESKGSREIIISTFADAIKTLLHFARDQKFVIAGIGIGMPGPFDYENGISLIKGVDKYESIYGLNLKMEFRKRLNLACEYPIYLENDGWAFTRGEAWMGAGKGYTRVIGLTLGTGLGSGFVLNDEIALEGKGIPPLAWIGGMRYENGIVDDRISRRGIIKRYLELNAHGSSQIDVKEIAQKAEKGDLTALRSFEETGRILGQILLPVISSFQPECIIVGGKIAHSYHLMSNSLEGTIRASISNIEIFRAQNIEYSALLGAGRFLFKNLGA